MLRNRFKPKEEKYALSGETDVTFGCDIFILSHTCSEAWLWPARHGHVQKNIESRTRLC